MNHPTAAIAVTAPVAALFFVFQKHSMRAGRGAPMECAQAVPRRRRRDTHPFGIEILIVPNGFVFHPPPGGELLPRATSRGSSTASVAPVTRPSRRSAAARTADSASSAASWLTEVRPTAVSCATGESS